MKILFRPIINPPHLSTENTWAEYVTDSLFHGLRSILGEDVVDYYRMDHMYRGATTHNLYGRGFTLFGLLPDLQIDRQDIDKKIAENYFDYVILTIHTSAAAVMGVNFKVVNDVFDATEKYYGPDKLIFVDSRDQADECYYGFKGRCQYFKRELDNRDWAKPISISIPQQQILTELPKKTKQFSCSIPGEGYPFVWQKDYYEDYATSLFGYTQKRGGWDCMRHYEILANACVPLFLDIQSCPPRTLANFPKSLCQKAMDNFWLRRGVVKEGFSQQLYDEIQGKLHEHTLRYLTTEASAKYLLSEIMSVG